MCSFECGQLQALICYNQFSEYIFNFRINASKQPQSILRRLFRCMLDVVMMTKLLTYECKTLPVNNFVLFTVSVCTDLIHWLLHLCCRNWGLPSWQNWFREGSQRANDTWNDYYEKEIKRPYSSETSLSTTCSAAFGLGLRAGKKATAGGTSTPPATSGSLTPRSTSCRGRWDWRHSFRRTSCCVVQKGRFEMCQKGKCTTKALTRPHI